MSRFERERRCCRGRDHGHTAPEHAAWLWIISDPACIRRVVIAYKRNGHLEPKSASSSLCQLLLFCHRPCRRQRAHLRRCPAWPPTRRAPSSPIHPTATLACQAKARTRHSLDRARAATHRCTLSRTSQAIRPQSSRRKLSRRHKLNEQSRARWVQRLYLVLLSAQHICTGLHTHQPRC